MTIRRRRLLLGMALMLATSGCTDDDDDDDGTLDLAPTDDLPGSGSGSSTDDPPPSYGGTPTDCNDPQNPCACLPGTVSCSVLLWDGNPLTVCLNPSVCETARVCPTGMGGLDAGSVQDAEVDDATADASGAIDAAAGVDAYVRDGGSRDDAADRGTAQRDASSD